MAENIKSRCGEEEKRKKRDNPQRLTWLHYYIILIPFLLSSRPKELSPIAPHFIDDVACAFGSAGSE